VDADDLAAVLRRHQASRGLNSTEAAVLADVLAGNIEAARPLSNPVRVALGRLRNAALVTHDDTPQLTDDVAFSLML
jgi:hypothetical protein